VLGHASGFVAPRIMAKLVAGTPDLAIRRLFLDYNFDLNQGFSSVYVAAWCLAIILWSITILKTRRFAAGLGIYGVIMGLGIISALFSGKLALDVHGFGLVSFAQSVWFIIAGILLLRSDAGTAALAFSTDEIA
jgi:hypothetical protein